MDIIRTGEGKGSRYQAYGLKRILVTRLQEVCRAAPRRFRFESHQKFAEEWASSQSRGRLELLGRILAASGSNSTQALNPDGEDFLIQLAAGTLREPRDQLAAPPSLTIAPPKANVSPRPMIERPRAVPQQTALALG